MNPVRARRMADLYGFYRVDHVVGLYRTYFFTDQPTGTFTPSEEPAQIANGERVLGILSQRAKVIAEDLGVVPPFIRASLDRLGVAEITALTLTTGGEPIPTLRDLLAQVAGRVPLLIELKSDRDKPAGSPSIRDLCRAVRRELDGYPGPVAVMSFDPRVGAWFARRAPEVVRGLVVTEQGSRTWSGSIRRRLALWEARAQFLAYDVRDLPSSFASRQRQRGLPLLTWTVSMPALRERAAAHADAPIAEGGGL